MCARARARARACVLMKMSIACLTLIYDQSDESAVCGL